MMRKAESLTEMSRFEKLHGEDAAKKVRRHGEGMKYQDVEDLCFIQRRAELVDARYAIL